MKNIVLYGAGGYGKEIAYLIEVINYEHPDTYCLWGFVVDDEYYEKGKTINGYPLLGTSQWLLDHKDEVVCTCTIGTNPVRRQEIQESLEKQGVQFETLISPYVWVHETVIIGPGTIVPTGVGFTVNSVIGKGVILNGSCLIGHDVKIGDYSCLMTGSIVSGNVEIGKRVSVGGASFIVPKKKIGDDAVVAAGSVVFTNVKPGTHVLGNPAKRISL